MAMGIVSDKDFDLEKEKLCPNSDKIPTYPNKSPASEKGRGVGNVEVPNSLRKMIGQTAIEDGRDEALQLAEKFGISSSSVSAYTNGSTSTASYDVRPNLGILNHTKVKVGKIAMSKLKKALHHITEDKLADAKVIELATVARNMAGIVKDMEPDSDKSHNESKSGPTFVFYSPQFKREEHFDVVHTKE